MMSFRSFDFREDWHLVKIHLGLKWTEDTRGFVVMNGAEVAAIAIFNNWSYSSVQLHWWTSTPMVFKHGMLEEVYNYAFNIGGLESILGIVPEDNEKALKLNAHIGLKEVGRIPNGYRNDIDYVIMQGTYEDLAKWNPNKEAA